MFLKNKGFFLKKRKDEFGKLNGKQVEWQLANVDHLVFEVTDACNLKCKYCGYGEFYADYDERVNKYMPFEIAREMISYLAALWQSPLNYSRNHNVTIGFYGGEPLMNMDFIKSVIDYLEKLPIPKIHFNWSMTTNALLLGKNMDFLVEKNFNILISLDGNEENHSYRVKHNNKNSFRDVLQNIKQLQQKYPDFFKKNVNFNSVLHNKNSVSEIFNYIKKEFDKNPSINELNDVGIRPEKVEEFKKTYRNNYQSLQQAENYEEIINESMLNNPDFKGLVSFMSQYSGNIFEKYTDMLSVKIKKIYLPSGTCTPFSKKIFVTVNGKILPCERIGFQHALGTVSKSGVELDFEKIAQRINSYYEKITDQCMSCHRTQTCVQCIYYLDKLDERPVCKGFTNEKRFSDYLASNISYLENKPEDFKKAFEEVSIG
ncbi:MAG: radical SAM peptide maturase [Bacteroidales bacterium]|nr:MAG: radical SAM peptide maturase [Bacteroidales bacterium]